MIVLHARRIEKNRPERVWQSLKFPRFNYCILSIKMKKYGRMTTHDL